MNKNEITSVSQDFLKNVSGVLEKAKQNAKTAVNLSMVYAYYEIGRMIVEEEQHGENRAAYGKQLLKELSAYLTGAFGKGYSAENLKLMRRFYNVYSNDQIGETVFTQFENLPSVSTGRKFYLSWSHYLKLMRIDNIEERHFYEIESIKNDWSLSELKRQYDTKTTTPGVRKYYAANKFERLYKPDLMDNLFVILNLWKVINKGEELEGEDWSKNIKIRQSLDTLTSYPNEFWKYPVVIYYICYRNEADFETKFGLFLNKLLLELMTKYLLIPTINAVKPDILKLNSAIVASAVPAFDFKEIDTSRLEACIQNPNRSVVRMLLKTLAYEEQEELLPAKWEIEHIFPQKWQTNYFTDIPANTIKEKIEHIGNKLPFEKKLNIVAGNGYFAKKKKNYVDSKIAITKEMGTSEVLEWDLESITKRDIRISDEIIAILDRWNKAYLNVPTDEGEEEKPSEEQLAQIEEFKKKGWI